MTAIASTAPLRARRRQRRFTINARTIVLALFCAVWIYPFVWLLLIPFRIVGFAVGGVLEFLKAILYLPARLLGGPSRA